MVRSLYTAWTGMYTEQKRLDIISNNLANSATVGYKKEGVTSQSFDDVMTIKIRDESVGWRKERIGEMNLGVKIGEIYTDYNQSSLRESGNTYDLAMDGSGFFSVNVTNSAGETSTKYTRAGNFHITKDGYIVDVDGNHLQGESGDLQVPVDAGDVLVDEDGSVYADGVLIDRLIIKDFEDYSYLKKLGNLFYQPEEGYQEKEAEGAVRQGYAEQSNVNVVSEMVNMIAITRAYEAGQKVIKTVDSTLEQAVLSLGKV